MNDNNHVTPSQGIQIVRPSEKGRICVCKDLNVPVYWVMRKFGFNKIKKSQSWAWCKVES
jgi:hypothetical protein